MSRCWLHCKARTKPICHVLCAQHQALSPLELRAKLWNGIWTQLNCSVPSSSSSSSRCCWLQARRSTARVHACMQVSYMSLLASLFLLPVLRGRVLQNHEASLWKNHENATAVGAHQSAQWSGYLGNVHLLHVLYISPLASLVSQPLLLHKTTPSSPDSWTQGLKNHQGDAF